MATKPGYLFVLSWAISETGGVNEVVRNLYRKAKTNGEFEPAILVLTWNPDKIVQEAEWTQIPVLLRNPWDSRRRMRSCLSFLVHLPQSLWALRKLLRERNVEVINPHFPGLPCLHFVLLRTFRFFSGALVLSFHGSDVKLATQTRGIEKALWRLLMRSADYIVAVSQDLGNHLLGLEPRIKSRLQTIWNGVEETDLVTEAESAGEPTSLVREMHGRRFLLNVATFEHQKAQDVLIDAYKRVLACHSDVDLIMVGRTGPTSQAVRNMLSSNGLQDRVLMLENVPHSSIPVWMNRAEIFVLPSRSEGFPITILEAGACGKPVVATQVGGIPELISDRVTGRLVAPDDAEALAGALIDLLGNPVERQRLGANLRERVTREFTWQRAYDHYVSLCKEALTQPRLS